MALSQARFQAREPKRKTWIRRVAVATGLLVILFMASLVVSPDWVSGLTYFRIPSLSSYRLYSQGMAYLDESYKPGFVDEAIKSFEEALAADPESAAANAGLASAFTEKNTG